MLPDSQQFGILPGHKGARLPLPSTTPYADCRYSPDILQFHPSFLLSRSFVWDVLLRWGRNEILITQLRQLPDFFFSFFDPLSHPYNDSALAAHPRKPAYRCYGCTHLLRWRHRAILLVYSPSAPAETDRWQEYAATMGYYSLWMPQSIPVSSSSAAFSVFCAQPRHTCHLTDRFLLRTVAA